MIEHSVGILEQCGNGLVIPNLYQAMTEGDHHQADREAAFVALFDAYYPEVLAYTSRRLGRDAGADAAADTFIAAWLKFGQLECDPLIWLCGLARGAVANHRRRIQRTQRLNDRARELSISPRPGDSADEVTWRYAVSAALAQLRDEDSEILSLVAWEGLSPAEGAAVLGCSVGEVLLSPYAARSGDAHARVVTGQMNTTTPCFGTTPNREFHETWTHPET